MANPEIVTGARGPRGTRPPKSAEPESVQAAGGIPENEVWYQARYARLRVQLTAPQDTKLPDGRIIVSEPTVAQFDQSMLKLNLDKEKDKKIHNLLQEHVNLNNTFWNFQDVLDQAKRDEREAAIKPLRDPDQRRLIIEALQAEGVDFEMPKAPPSSKPTKSKEGDKDEDGSDEV